MFTRLLAVVLANQWIPDSLTTKIKTSEIWILACHAKICTHKNYQPYSRLNTHLHSATTIKFSCTTAGRIRRQLAQTCPHNGLHSSCYTILGAWMNTGCACFPINCNSQLLGKPTATILLSLAKSRPPPGLEPSPPPPPPYPTVVNVNYLYLLHVALQQFGHLVRRHVYFQSQFWSILENNT